MKKILFILAGTLVLAGCKSYKNYERPQSIEDTAKEQLFRDVQGTDTMSFGNRPWREVFTDAQLQQLIEKALAQNTDLQKADHNIKKARIGLKVSKLSYLPTLAVAPQGSITSTDGMKAIKTYTLPLSLSWELGSWSSLRNNRKKAGVDTLIAASAKQATQTAIVSAVANLYYTMQMLDEQLRTTNETVVLWKKNVDAMEAMHEAGLTTNAAVAQARANFYELQTTVPTLEHSIRQTENALCVILNEAPHPIARSAFNADAFPADFSTGVPLQLLSSRPDVKIAELQLASAFYNTNIARSAFYPSLTLTGTAGWTNSAGSAIMNPAVFLANAVGSLVQPLFAQGKLRAQYKIAKIEEESLTLDFRNTLLTAGQEVSDALSSYQTATAKAEKRKLEVEQLEQALEKTLFLFSHGNTTSYLETLTAQQSLLSAKLKLISDKYDKLQAGISLYQALGGGRDK